MIVFADYTPIEDCENDDVIELCRQCNKCGRFTAQKEAQEKRVHQKFLIKIMINNLGFSQEEKRAFLLEVMQELNLTQPKIIEEARE